MDINQVVHFFKIRVCTKLGGDTIEILRWDDMSFTIRMKWDWYFKYRAALLQVKYPKNYVECTWGHEEPKELQKQHYITNKITAKKRKITEYENKLKRYKDSYRGIFPIEEDIAYNNTICKIERLKKELYDLKESNNDS